MDYLGLIFEVVFLIMGVYLYLFSRGIVMPKEKVVNANAEKFRKENGNWIRIGSLILIAVMSLEVFLHIKQLFF